MAHIRSNNLETCSHSHSTHATYAKHTHCAHRHTALSAYEDRRAERGWPTDTSAAVHQTASPEHVSVYWRHRWCRRWCWRGCYLVPACTHILTYTRTHTQAHARTHADEHRRHAECVATSSRRAHQPITVYGAYIVFMISFALMWGSGGKRFHRGYDNLE